MLTISEHGENLPSWPASRLRPSSALIQRFVNSFLRIVAGTMTPRQTIRLSGVISCARHEELGQRLAVNSFTVVRLKYSKRRELKSTIFRLVLPFSSAQDPPTGQIYLSEFLCFGATIPIARLRPAIR